MNLPQQRISSRLTTGLLGGDVLPLVFAGLLGGAGREGARGAGAQLPAHALTRGLLLQNTNTHTVYNTHARYRHTTWTFCYTTN